MLCPAGWSFTVARSTNANTSLDGRQGIRCCTADLFVVPLCGPLGAAVYHSDVAVRVWARQHSPQHVAIADRASPQFPNASILEPRALLTNLTGSATRLAGAKRS